jgi:PTS system nitrogen regulatory IIA component
MDNEILTLEEVAQYLRVSERTVYDWAQKGEIPAGKIGTAWRFRRNEIKKWVNSKLSKGTPLTDDHTIRIDHLLIPDRVLFLRSSSKHDALLELIYCLADSPQVKNAEQLKEGIFKREDLMSTGIGFGIAIPHIRLSSVRDLVIAAGISREGIKDYGSLDNQPIQIILMLAAGEEQHAYYLKALSFLSSRLKQPDIKEKVIAAKTPEEAYRALTGREE